MFAEECRKVARDYPDVAFEEMMIDSISMKLVTAPQQFDVVVTTRVRRHLDRYRRGAGGRAGPGTRSVRRRAAGDGASNPRLRAPPPPPPTPPIPPPHSVP